MKKHPMLKYLKEEGPAGPRLPLIMCPGCGAGQVLNYALHAVDTILQEDALRKEDFVFISGVGCSSRLASHYLNFDSGWTLHGRALAVATGALLANPRLKIVVFTGDGDAAAIGGNHFIHTCRRNMDYDHPVHEQRPLWHDRRAGGAHDPHRPDHDHHPLRECGRRVRPLPPGPNGRRHLCGPLDHGAPPSGDQIHYQRNPQERHRLHRNPVPVPGASARRPRWRCSET